MNISKSIKSKITGTFSHNNNISVSLGTFIHGDTYRLSTKLDMCYKVNNKYKAF